MEIVIDNRSSSLEEPAVTFTPGVCGGDPCVPGTRIPAALLYVYARELRYTVFDLVREYPELRVEQVTRAIQYIEEHPCWYVEWKEQYDEPAQG